MLVTCKRVFSFNFLEIQAQKALSFLSSKKTKLCSDHRLRFSKKYIFKGCDEKRKLQWTKKSAAIYVNRQPNCTFLQVDIDQTAVSPVDVDHSTFLGGQQI